MYTPKAFNIDEPEWIEAFMAVHSFATLTAVVAGEVEATHVPLNRLGGDICGHVAVGNALARLEDGTTATAIFHGPHAYISPRYYHTEFNVPTWNYAAVHCRGRLRYIDDPTAVWRLFHEMVAVYEGREGWHLPAEDRYQAMLKGIRFFCLEECRFEAKAKFSQNKGRDDIAAVVEALEAGGQKEVADLMRRLNEADTGG
jgi:transcriptional regulator